ncbi:MAG: radical SAM protein [candidate division WOR-3 bacterium]
MANFFILLHAIFRAVRKKPFFISHLITGSCNCQCLTCKWRNSIPDRDLSAIIDFYRRARDLGFYATTLWGGEPLLRTDILEIVREIKSLGFKIGLITNGYFLNEKIAVTDYLDFLIISIDATGKRLDEIRKVDGLYERTLEGISNQRCKRLIINTVVSDFSYPDCLRVADLARAYRCPIFFEYPTGKGLISPETARNAFAKILKLKEMGYPVGNSKSYLEAAHLGKFEYSCRAHDVAITIDNAGFLKNCINQKVIGNVYEEDLAEVLSRPDYQNLKKMSRHCHRCTDSGAFETAKTARLELDVLINSLRLFCNKISVRK